MDESMQRKQGCQETSGTAQALRAAPFPINTGLILSDPIQTDSGQIPVLPERLLLVVDKGSRGETRAERTLWYVSTANPKADAVYDS